MGIAHSINLEEAESFAAPEHLVTHFNSGVIDYEQMAVLSAKHYLKELTTLVDENAGKESQAENLQNLLTASALEKASLKAKLADFEHQDLALAMARNEVSSLNARIGEATSLEAANVALAADVKAMRNELELKGTAIANAASTERRYKTLLDEHYDLKESLAEQTAKAKRLESLSLAHDTNVEELRNTVKVNKAANERLLATISQVKAELKTERETADELRSIIREIPESIDDAKAAINTVAKSILTLDLNQKALDKENRHLSLYVSAHTAAPIFETPQGHQLKALMLDKNQIVSSGGKEVIEDDTALFQWVNPNGFGCLVALSADASKGELLLLPSLVDENIAGRLTPTGKKVAKNLTDAIAPPKEYYEIIARHIKDFSVQEFKKAMLKAFARATYLTNETEHLTLDAGGNMVAGDIAAFKEMADSHDRVLARNLLRRKQALRPKSKTSKTKNKKRR